VILMPEIEYDIDIVAKYLKKRAVNKKPYSIVVIAEGIACPRVEKPGHYIAQEISNRTGLETRETILGYIQRGGSPSPMDRVLATRYGAYAVELIAEGRFGNMVSLHNDDVVAVPLKDVGGKLRTVPLNHALIEKANRMGVCFGNCKV